MTTQELTAADLEAARKLVRIYDVHEGDRVLITRDPHVEPIVTEAIGRVCREQGAIVYDLLMPNALLDLRGKDIAHAWEFFFRGIEGGVDLVISTVAGVTGPSIMKAQVEYGTPLGQAQCYTLEHFRSDLWQFPHELQVEIFNRVVNLIEGKRELRITSPSGTDYTVTIPPGKLIIIGDGGLRVLPRPGTWLGFPGGCVAFYPETSNGVWVVNYITAVNGPAATIDNPFTDLKNPMVVTVKDSWLVDIKGDLSKEMVELWETKGNKASRFVTGPMLGVSPKAYPIGWPEAEPIQWYYPFHYSPLCCWLFLGGAVGQSWHREVSAPITTTAYTYKPTWIVDGEVVLQNGRFKFMDDPELRKMAARFGDPDELLKTKPFPPEMFDEEPGGKAVLQKLRGKGQ